MHLTVSHHCRLVALQTKPSWLAAHMSDYCGIVLHLITVIKPPRSHLQSAAAQVPPAAARPTLPSAIQYIKLIRPPTGTGAHSQGPATCSHSITPHHARALFI
uniref:Uncharacterized protein n=1 Tax=Chlamydomonas leiostraca TaxID=1034604 RepID=A0A7S0S5F3_9CHLO